MLFRIHLFEVQTGTDFGVINIVSVISLVDLQEFMRFGMRRKSCRGGDKWNLSKP